MLIAQLRVLLPEAWWVGVGISFSFLTGSVVRAPSWMQNTGLEWIHRLAQEPGRLFKRYVYHGLPFAASLLASATTRRLMSKLQRSPVRGRVLAAIEAPPPDEAAAPINGIGHATETQPWPGRVEPVSPPATGSSATRHLHRLRALVLLGGSVRVNELVQHCQRSVLDLPLDENGTIFCHWLDHAAEVARLVGLKELPLRVLVDRLSPEPSSAAPKHYGTFSVERDVNEFRGTAGLLSDLADKYEDEDLILVANAAQILLDPLAGIASALDRLGADAGVISHTDGTPSGIMLFSGKTLRVIPRSGFVDMKEQSLPTIASQFDVRVVERRRPTGLPIRSLGDYVSALRLYHRRRRGLLARLDPLGEETKPSFTLVEEGAKVDPSALLHDAVVLKGGSVEAGAVVVRSVVCGAASVKRDARAVDQFVVRIPG